MEIVSCTLLMARDHSVTLDEIASWFCIYRNENLWLPAAFSVKRTPFLTEKNLLPLGKKPLRHPVQKEMISVKIYLPWKLKGFVTILDEAFCLLWWDSKCREPNPSQTDLPLNSSTSSRAPVKGRFLLFLLWNLYCGYSESTHWGDLNEYLLFGEEI